MRRACGLALFLALPARALEAPPPEAPASVALVRRGTMKLLVHVQGTVRPEQLYRLRSTIEGRIETVDKTPNSWSGERSPIGTLLTKEMAALVDANATTPTDVLEQRWNGEFQATPIACPGQCFVVRVYAQRGTLVRPGTLLAEAAGKLRLVGRVRPGDTGWVREGQVVRFWPKGAPSRRQEARIERFVRDTQGENVVPGGTFTVLLTPEAWLDAGTEWEGVIEAEVRKDVISVPTKALLVYGGQAYLPVRVSTGVTTYDETQIIAGIPAGTQVLMLGPGSAGAVQRHVPPPEPVERYELDEQGRRVPVKKPKPKETEEAPPPPRPATIAPERWDKPRRAKQKPGAIDVFPDDAPSGGKDDRFPSDL